MPNKIWAILAILIVAGGLIKWGHSATYNSGYNKHKAESLEAVNEAVAIARKNEQTKQGKVNEAAQIQFDEITNTNIVLNADLSRLRNRSARTKPTKQPKISCKGATGINLSGEDARFLTREAARADTLRTALKGCYSYVDSIQ